MGFAARLGGAWRELVGHKSDDGLGSSALANLIRVYGGRESKTGQSVTVETALQVQTVLACVRILANGISQVPFKLLRARSDGRGVDPAVDHPLYDLLVTKPNDWQDSFTFRETLVMHLALIFDFFALKNTVGRRQEIRELIPLLPGRVQPKRSADLRLSYVVMAEDGTRREYPQEAIWHVRGPSWNSWAGMDAIRLIREAVGLTLAIEDDQARLYKNGLKTSGSYSVEGNLTPEQHDLLAEWIKQHFTRDEAYSPLILDRAAKWTPFTMTGVDAQTLESRKYQDELICRALGVIPLMAGISDKTATYASAEQMFIAHVVHGLVPLGTRIEKSADAFLLTAADRRAGLKFKFNFNGMMRGAAKDRAEYFAKALGSGGSPAWLTQNEVRDYEDINPMDDPGADKLPQITNAPAPAPAAAPAGDA